MSDDRPRYIQRGGKQIYSQPFAINGVDYYAFLLQADADCIQQHLLDPLLNVPSQGQLQFEPWGPWCLLVFNNLARLASSAGPDAGKGWFTERESAIWLLTREKRSGQLYWFMPYIFVDNAYALCMGRETYGFCKGIGAFTIPHDPHYASCLDVQTIVVPTYTDFTQARWQTLWTANQTTKGSGILLLHDLAALRSALGEVLSEEVKAAHWPALFELLKMFIERKAPMAFLKQFPAIDDQTKACYQAITATTMKMTRFNALAFLDGNWQVTLADVASHPVRRELGFASGDLTPIVSCYVNIDFALGNGSVLHDASGG
jgi:hypothetical protein